MRMNAKRIFALALTLAILCTLLPARPAWAAEEDAPQVLTQEDYAEADLVFDQINEAESEPAKRNHTQTQKTEEAIAIVTASDSYVEGSLERSGNAFTWWTDSGIRCIYNPRMRRISSEQTPQTAINEIVNEPQPVRGGTPAGNQVYLIGPYYGSDVNFTDQYKNEASRVAAAIGDTDGYTLYSGTAATIDKVAEAVSNGAVVFFDSHGTTDYENPNDELDFITGATNSYLCLSTRTGLTNEDYTDGAGYSGGTAYVNGAAIANHMTKDSPNGLLWMAICLGMGTDTLHKPLRERGVEVVYGYSESVSFDGDYLYEETFWGEMTAGSTVASAISTMKNKWGNWDCSSEMFYDGYATIAEARADFVAFPVVVSDEDAFPGKRTALWNETNGFFGADSLQTVRSTYTLGEIHTEQYTVTYCVPAGVAAVEAETVTSGKSVTLPTPGTPDAKYTFAGWATTPVEENTQSAPTLYHGSYWPPADTVLYAVYTYTVGGTGAANVYQKVTTAPTDWSGDYLIVYEEGGVAFDGGLTKLDAPNNTIDVTITDGKIAKNTTTEAAQFTVAAVSGGYSIQSASGYFIGSTNYSNELKTSTSSAYANALSVDTDNNTVITAESGTTMRFNANGDQMRFRYHKSGQQPVALYKASAGGTTYYTSLSCGHAHTEVRDEVPAQCEQAGNEAGVFCTDCQTYISGGAVIPALEHDMQPSVIVPPTATTDGYTLYTCANGCGKTEDRDFVEATGEEFTVTFAVPAGVAAVEAMTINSKTGNTLPTAGVPDAKYTFAGWATAAVAEDTEDAPTLYNGNYKPTANITLYAVYTYETEGTGSSGYVKVTTAPADWSGEYLIVYEGASFAFNGGLGTLDAIDNYITVNIVDDTIASNATTDAAKFTIATKNGGYSIQSASGKYIGQTSNANGLSTNASSNYTNTITLKKNGDEIDVVSGGAYLRFNATSGQDRFRYYKSSSYTNQKPIALYKASAGGSSTTYYTSAGATVPVPEIKLSYVAGSFDSAMTFYFLEPVANLEQFEDVYVEFAAQGKETARVDAEKIFTIGGVQYYAFGFTQLNIRDLGLTVSATIHGTFNGQPVSGATKSYSLLQYCAYAINGNTNDALPCAYLLKYAQAAEEFKNVPANERLDVTALESKMDAIFAANSDIEAAEPVRNTAHTPGTQIAFAGQNVNMATRVSMIYYLDLRSYTGDQEKVTVTVGYTDGVTGQPAQKTYQFSELVANSAEGFYEVHFGEHLLTQMNDEITCTVYIDGVFETSYQNSIEHYCYTTVNNANSSAAEIELAKSIYCYGVACAAAYGS